MRALCGYLIAAVLGGLSQLVRDPAWLGLALLCLAFVIALLASLGLVRANGWVRKKATSPVAQRTADAGQQYNGRKPAQAAQPAREPRPVGPVGPIPVLQKQPKSSTPDAGGGAPGSGSPDPSKAD